MTGFICTSKSCFSYIINFLNIPGFVCSSGPNLTMISFLCSNGKMVAAKVVDQCEGCSDHQVDATKGVFQELAGLDVGQLEGVHVVVFSNSGN